MSRATNQEATAYHEAGHAVAAFWQHVSIRRLSIIPDGESLGRLTHWPPPSWFQPDISADGRTRLRLEAEIVCLLAGPEAERAYRGRRNNVGARSDHQVAADLALYVGGSSAGSTAFLRWCEVEATALVKARWPQIEALAAEVLRRRQMSGRAVSAFLRSFLQGEIKRPGGMTGQNRGVPVSRHPS